MLTKDQILQKLNSPRTKLWIEGLTHELQSEGFDIKDLLELTIHPNDQTAFHAAWLLDNIVTGDVRHYVQYINEFINYSGQTKHHSCCRHYARIFVSFTGAKVDKSVKDKIEKTGMEPVVEQCFDWLINPAIKVAVKACGAQVLFNLRYRYSWIAEELQSQLMYLMKNGSPAIQATGRRLLKELTTD